MILNTTLLFAGVYNAAAQRQSSMIAGVERFLKQAIVDKNPAVASAALVSALHLFNDNKEVVKRWSNEVQEACNSKCMPAKPTRSQEPHGGGATAANCALTLAPCGCATSHHGPVPRARPALPDQAEGPHGRHQDGPVVWARRPAVPAGAVHAPPLRRQGHGGRGADQRVRSSTPLGAECAECAECGYA